MIHHRTSQRHEAIVAMVEKEEIEGIVAASPKMGENTSEEEVVYPVTIFCYLIICTNICLLLRRRVNYIICTPSFINYLLMKHGEYIHLHKKV